MKYPSIHLDNMNVKISFGNYTLHVLYVCCGYFFNPMHMHSHSNKSYELHLIPSGYGTLIANGHAYPISPGTLFMTGPGVAHEQLASSDDPMFEYCICFEVVPGAARAYSGQTDDEQELDAIGKLLSGTSFWIGQDTQNMLSAFEQLSDETSNRFIGYSIVVKNIIEQIVIKLVRNYTNNRPSMSKIRGKTLDDNRLVLIDQSFLYNYRSITLQMLADLLGLSKRQTERTLKNEYGLTFTQKRTEARLHAAAHLLKTTSMPVNDIAKSVGYSAFEHFCQSFKKRYRVSAGAYRMSHRSDNE
ncbi:AraC family transcriptional regulator [Paenibacillus alkalitolerans]|uniref:AraC family transcriptional regulator n=1 Tax=Paenibacillus alkalitolerans TaxID=2799335 RepID=UPI0018F2845C|nr:AraC family transcriptional regulator [Paenibacillus alkalitolerans]